MSKRSAALNAGSLITLDAEGTNLRMISKEKNLQKWAFSSFSR